MADKPIWVALDTEQVRDWICSNPDVVNDKLADEDGNEVDDATFDKAIDWIVERTTDGRLSRELNECLYSTWLGEKFNDLIWDVLFDFVYNELDAFNMDKED